MAVDPQATLTLTDANNAALGDVSIKRIEGIRVFATFRPGKDFAPLKPLFEEFEQAVNDQVFSLADELAERIEQLGLRVSSAADSIQLDDVQLMNGTDLCFEIPHLGLIQRNEATVGTNR